MVRKLRGLEDIVGMTVVDWLMGPDGWKFNADRPGCQADPVYNARTLKEFYLKADPQYQGRVTVPILWDKQKETIVSNESADIIRIFYTAFDSILDNQSPIDFLPRGRLEEVDELNGWIYDGLNNGVYRAGFATSQAAYEEAAIQVADTLKRVEAHLSVNTWMLPGVDHPTEVDIRLFTTIVRFDPAYFGLFKCNLLAVRDCPSVLRWLRATYALVADTVNLEHIKRGYYEGMRHLNPNGIVPLSNGPPLSPASPIDKSNN
jgi:putative glutathione S-transferase